MTRPELKERIKSGFFLLDGAMGTQLMKRGLKPGKSFSLVNLDSPQIVADIHGQYFAAGSDAVLTNTFSANKFALARYKLEDKVVEINLAAAKIAREAAGREKYVLGDIGPSGDFLEPLGTLRKPELAEAFTEQANALIESGIDGIIIETMTALNELTVAIESVKKVCGPLPVFASMAFDHTKKGFHTPMGVDVSSAVTAMIDAGADAVGFNCGVVPVGEYEKLAREFAAFARAIGDNTPAFAKPNAGLPKLQGECVVYGLVPDDFAAEILAVYQAGIGIIGGCCGTTPAHIKAINDLLRPRQKH